MGSVKVIRQKKGKDSKNETNRKSGSSNGESLLRPINSYEQTKI